MENSYQPKTLEEIYDIAQHEKPARIGYDANIDAHFCPYCQRFIDDEQIEQIRCNYCQKLLAWY